MDDATDYDVQLKILIIGDSGVGKSSLLLRFTDPKHFADDLTPTIGVDFKTKIVQHEGTRVKLTLWDTAGQERFRTLTSSYYRGAHGIIYVYDVTRAETLDSISDIWMKEVDLFSTVEGAVQMIVANKIDMEDVREVTHQQGVDLAKRCGCLFVETSAKINVAVEQAFNELVLKILHSSPQVTQQTGALRAASSASQRSMCC